MNDHITIAADGSVEQAFISTVATLATSDTIELWVQNETGTNDVTIQDAELAVR